MPSFVVGIATLTYEEAAVCVGIPFPQFVSNVDGWILIILDTQQNLKLRKEKREQVRTRLRGESMTGYLCTDLGVSDTEVAFEILF